MKYLHLLSLIELTANHAELSNLVLKFNLTKEFCFLMEKEIIFINNKSEVYINKKHKNIFESFGSILETTINLTVSK